MKTQLSSSPETRSFGEFIAHVSDTSYGICAGAIGDKTKSFGNAEKTMTKKTEIVAALKAAFAYCDAAFEKVNDQTGKEVTDFMNRQTPRLMALGFTTNHTWEHMETS
jgi:DinB superfamily